MSEAQESALPTGPGQLFEVVEEEVGGVPMRVFRNTPPTLRDIWAGSAAHGDAPYLVFEGRRLTFAEAHERVAALAAQLAGPLGVAPGDRVAIAMRNLPEWVVAFWAATCAGAVVVPLNGWWTGPELAYGLSDSGSTVLVADGERLDRLADHLGDTSVRTVVVVEPGDRVPVGTLAFDDLLSGPGELPDVTRAPDDDCIIMYTSGTTGRPKGAVGTHRNVTSSVMNLLWVAMGAAARAAAASTGDGGGATPTPPGPPATLLTMPLFHVGGLHTVLLPYTAAGAKVVLMRRWNAAEALDLIEGEELTVLGGVPTTLFDLLDEARKQGRSVSSLGSVGSGATLVPPELARRIDDQLGSRAAPGNAYGLTETSGVAIYNTGGDYLAHAESVGKPVSPVVEVRIATPDGSPASDGEVGEVWLRGPIIIRGYHGRPDATAEAIADGWFHTGDLGRIEDGFVYIVDRLKDVIIRGGENVYAAEVEAALYEHPDVTEAAIVGLPHERLGEEVAAVVRLREGSTADADALRAHVAERLAAFKVPTVVELTEGPLPRNATGKVLKRELRESLAPA